MTDVKLGKKIFEGVQAIKFNTPSGETVQVSTEIPYVIGDPVPVTLSAATWNGSRYSLRVDGYRVGSYGLQIGIPSNSSVVNTQILVEAALTVSDYKSYSSNAESGSPAYITAVIASVNTPTTDVNIWLFGLEVAA